MTGLLFATFDGGGNVPVVIAVAAEAARRGHRVTVLSHEWQRAEVEAAGLAFRPYTHARAWDARADRGTLDGAVQLLRVQTDPGLARDVADEVAVTRPDLVVVDCMLLSVFRRLQTDGTDHVALFHTLYRYWAGSFRRGPVGLGSRLVGCGDPLQLWRGAAARIVCADPHLDRAARLAHPDATWTGAIHGVTATDDPTEPPEPVAHPRVLVSLSTVGYPGLARTLTRIVEAAADVPAQFVVTTGPALDPATLPGAANVDVHGYLPHGELMPGCSALVGHGGHSTTMRALAHGLPVLTLPMHPLLDQPVVGRAVADAGAGSVLRRTAGRARLRAAIAELVTDDRYRRNAAELGRRLHTEDAAGNVVDQLEAHAPVAKGTPR